MFKSTIKSLALGLLIALIGIGATVVPAPLTAAVTLPNPQQPINNILETTTKPTLRWSASIPASALDHYEYDVSTDSGFSNIIASDHAVPKGTKEAVVGPLTRAKTYFWRVRACDTSSACTTWSTAKFRVSIGAPNLVSPLDGSALTTNRDTFEWNGVVNATGYTIQVSNTTLFNSLLIDQSTSATVTKFTPAANLPVNQNLYWRVRALSNSFGPGPWSFAWSFTTANPPSVPTLLQPQDKKMTIDFSPRLHWSQATLPSGTTFAYYHVQVDKVSTFGTPSKIDDTTSTHKNIPYFDVPGASPLDPATTYYWRVRACNTVAGNTNCSAWSDYFTLYTSVDAPSLTAPANSMTLPDNRPTFQWTVIPYTMNYILELSTSPKFIEPVAYRWFSPTTSYRPLTPLPPNVTYYWRVRGGHPLYGPGLPSIRWSFTTANPPETPNLISPTSNALATSALPTMKWTFSATPPGTTFNYYHVQIDDNDDFSSPVEDNTNVTNQYTPYLNAANYNAPLSRLTRYYWRVRACNNDLPNGCSDWSPSWFFRVAAAAPTNLVSAPPTLDWSDVLGASVYYVEIYKNGVLFQKLTTNVSNANLGLLMPGTYKWSVRVRATFSPGFAPSAWSVTDVFIIP